MDTRTITNRQAADDAHWATIARCTPHAEPRWREIVRSLAHRPALTADLLPSLEHHVRSAV